jgi:quercetin dioxygenase-like cupin family protein
MDNLHKVIHSVPAGHGSPVTMFDQRVVILSRASQTGGSLGAIEVTSLQGGAPPMHIHDREDEAFYILEGDYTVFVGDEQIQANPGAWAYGPRGTRHGYRVESPTGRHISLILPGGFESFFEEVAEFAIPGTPPPAVMERMSAVATRYGVKLLGPPPS